MERARTEWLRELGFNYAMAQEAGIYFVVHSMQIKYLQPARYEELLEVVSYPKEVNKVSVVFEQSIRAANNPEIVFCQGQITIVCVNKAQRPCAIPEFLLARLKSGN